MDEEELTLLAADAAVGRPTDDEVLATEDPIVLVVDAGGAGGRE